MTEKLNNGNLDAETRRVFMEELKRTRGWQILREEILAKKENDTNKLINGSPSNIKMDDVVVSRARIKLVDEILSLVK